MNPFSLKNKKILITGASSGIGAEAALTCAKMGATVILTARNRERLKKTYNLLPEGNHSIIGADLTINEEIEELVYQITQIDGIVHSSGIVRPFPVKFIGTKQIDEMFNINYKGPVLLTSKLFRAKKIKKGASLVFMSSISSKFPHKGGALYSGTKAALNTYSKTIALEYASQKIRSNVISAAMVKTPLFEEAEKAITKEMMDKHGEQYPLGFGEPKDIANAIVYLLSNASKWITGTELVMDGGLTAGQ
jgi:NAD(P)-dependent dehydrogenase (short-subunit alcohol dehydrogenase family)